ncbi:hypothetical protein LCI18_000918 [Fusarium solani-melongenae]|uniref:Uncharacterized protein n=1 Tax=Fusarium solani subsp. cucurbitae TaxID=2747967 RepID=A0ACD3YM82_FUSSC|nr:hypothetical protein LCI18_000918 [Fusarium solani-melongenae]
MAHALIFGASGISGWSLMNQARIYPSPTAFACITGTTNRPTSIGQLQIPDDDRIQLASGIDLTKSVDEVVAALKEKVPHVDTVSHVFFTVLTWTPSYGLEFPKEVNISPPLKETHPRIPEPWASKIFYYTQYDLLKDLSHGKKWTFSEIRPDGIVGFAPGSNAMNMAQGIAIYLTMVKEVNGAGAKVPFPGYEHGYHSTHSDTFQDILSKMEIYAALNPDNCGDGGVFNVADGKTITWAQVWPKLCEHFGLVGGQPDASATPMLDFVKKNKQAWINVAKRHGLNEKLIDEQGWGHTHFMIVDFDFDRQYDLSHARSVGFMEEIDTVNGYIQSWARMRAAKLLPPN